MKGKGFQVVLASVFAAAMTTTVVSPQAACAATNRRRASVRRDRRWEITLFDVASKNGHYTVLFQSRNGTQDWSRGRGVVKRDCGRRGRPLRVIPNVSSASPDQRLLTPTASCTRSATISSP